MDAKIFITNSDTQTQKIGKELAKSLKSKSLLLLTGDLGSGKTTFVKGLAKGLGIKKRINSPTFVLVKNYGRTLNHIDLYRLDNEEQIKSLDIESLIKDSLITVIEWAEKLNKSFLKLDKFLQIKQINFKYLGENQREITIYG